MPPADLIPEGITPAALDAFLATLTDKEAEIFEYESRYWWRGFHAREKQLMPAGRWVNWVLLAGRGFGKNRAGSEALREFVEAHPFARIALVGPTMADIRDVIIEGESGLLSVFPERERPDFLSSKRRVNFRNGAIGFLFSAEEPERLRGPQHHFAYLDEVATYKAPQLLWDNLKFGLRLGDDPRVIVTTTPKPSPFLRALIADTETIVTRGSTYENAANLAPAALAEFRRVYEGTRVGRQELDGELMDEADGALWQRANIERLRVRSHPELVRIVIAIDPAVTANEGSDETGIIAAGLGVDGDGYLLSDASCKVSAAQWAHRAVSQYDHWEADKIIAETNQGGDLVEETLKTVRRNLPIEKIHASRGKVTRAEPIASLYEQGKVHHCGGFPQLEDEMVNFVPGQLTRSPNRVDAMVYAMSALMLKPAHKGRALCL